MILGLLVSALAIWIPKLRWLSLLGIAVLLSEMIAETTMPSSKYPLLYWAEWALRYTTPLIAIMLFQGSGPSLSWGARLMRFAIALVFVDHGAKALLAEPQFIDYLIATFRRIGISVAETQSVIVLRVIGVADILLAVHLLILKPERNRAVLIWIAIWGAVTAFARITYGGVGNWHEVLIRSSHFVIPITLLINDRLAQRFPSANEPKSVLPHRDS